MNRYEAIDYKEVIKNLIRVTESYIDDPHYICVLEIHLDIAKDVLQKHDFIKEREKLLKIKDYKGLTTKELCEVEL